MSGQVYLILEAQVLSRKTKIRPATMFKSFFKATIKQMFLFLMCFCGKFMESPVDRISVWKKNVFSF